MDRISALIAAFVVAAVLAVSAPVAYGVEPADQAAIHEVVSGQLDAFQRDDWETAYAFSSHGIRTLYPTLESFVDMVTRRYQPVYRPRSIAFGPIIETSLGPVQRLFVTGPDGVAYIASYAMLRDSEGLWRINGCTLRRDRTPSI